MASATPPANELVERMGVLWEEDGLSRIAGRIIGHLLLQAEACSLDAMAEALAVSKASVSVDARRLERIGFVERVGRPGDRRDFYVIGTDMLARVIAQRIGSVRRLHEAIASARRLPENPPAVRERLSTFERQHARILQSLETLLADLNSSSDGFNAP